MDTTKPSNPKDRIGVTKPPFSMAPRTVDAEVNLGMLEGACKYGRHNYRVIGVRSSIYFDATMRHMNKWWEGEDDDPDSGLSHITKAICSLYVLRDAMIQDKLTDDRPPKAPEGFWKDLEVKTKEILARFPEPVAPYTQIGERKIPKSATMLCPKCHGYIMLATEVEEYGACPGCRPKRFKCDECERIFPVEEAQRYAGNLYCFGCARPEPIL